MDIDIKTSTIHKKDALLNREKLKDILDSKSMEYIELYRLVSEEYGLDITYKGFMSLLSNRSTWKLLYAWAIADILGIKMDDIFEIVDIDVQQREKEVRAWRKKYQKK